MKKFEYYIESFDLAIGMDIQPKLNNRGSEGWELISFTITPSGNIYNAIFKREIK